MSFRIYIDALRAGHELTNSETWKNRQAASSLVLAVLSAAVAVAGLLGFKADVSSDDLQSLAGGVVAAVGLLNGYLSLATSKRVGLPVQAGGDGEPRKAEPPDAAADMAGGVDHSPGG